MQIEKMETIDAKSLMSKELPEIQFIVEGLLPQGLQILAGKAKAGKSWLLLSLCLCVASGKTFWNRNTKQGVVLYLCLEDSENRLQARLDELTDEPPYYLYFATTAKSLTDGLTDQIEKFLKEHPDTVLIVIDTLQKVRGSIIDANPYASDYKDISHLKMVADKYSIAMIVVQHLRKQFDNDPHAMVTGSTGLLGAADGSYVLTREPEGNGTAKLHIRGRDVEEQVLTVHFDKENMVWKYVSSDTPEQEQFSQDSVLPLLLNFLQKKKSFHGTASELAALLKADCSIDVNGNVLTRKLHQYRMQFAEKGIHYSKTRTGSKREVHLSFSDNDGNDDDDGILES